MLKWALVIGHASRHACCILSYDWLMRKVLFAFILKAKFQRAESLNFSTLFSALSLQLRSLRKAKKKLNLIFRKACNNSYFILFYYCNFSQSRWCEGLLSLKVWIWMLFGPNLFCCYYRMSFKINYWSSFTLFPTPCNLKSEVPNAMVVVFNCCRGCWAEFEVIDGVNQVKSGK